MNIILWIIQILLAAVFITLGLAKAVVPMATLRKAMDWANDFEPRKVRMIGILESIGALGLFFPGLYPIHELIIPLAASGLAILMVFAAITNFNRGEQSELITNIVLFFLACFVVIGRLAFT